MLRIAAHMLLLGSEQLASSGADKFPRQGGEVQYHQEKEHRVFASWPYNSLPGYWRHSR